MNSVDWLLTSILASIIMLFTGYAWGNHTGQQTVHAAWDADRMRLVADTRKLERDHAQAMAQEVIKQTQVNIQNEKVHELKLSQVQADLAASRAESKRLGGLQFQARVDTNCPATNAQTASTGKRDETDTYTITLPEPIESGLWSIMGEADVLTEQLRSCQAWIKSNGFYEEKELIATP
jgi:hypothetical protein